MAGSERSGPEAARADLFHGRTWAVTPHPGSRPSGIAAVHRLARACGAVPVTLDAAEHDAAVAAVSHVPHAAAAAVAAALVTAPDAHLALTGTGLRDVTRVAAGDPQLWTQILWANADPVRRGLGAVRDRVQDLIDALDAAPVPSATSSSASSAAPSTGPPARSSAALTAALSAGVAGVRRLPGRHGPAEDLGAVTVLVADAPGQLARLFTDVGALGVDIADVRLDHRVAQAAGQAQLAVAPAAVEVLVAGLVAAGWDARPGTA